jgi:hypothetical protein
VTVLLVSRHTQPGFSQPRTAYDYTIVGGKKAFVGATGNGTATLHEFPARRPVSPPGALTPQFIIAPTFILRFGVTVR